MNFYNLNPFETIILITFSAALLIQLFYYSFFYIRIFFIKEKPKSGKDNPPVSVIICARDEAINLDNFLPSVLNQNFPDYEVIVVNDGSIDDTEDVLKRLKSLSERLYVTKIPTSGKFKNGKKLALSIGLKAAKNDWVVLTDADCKPVSQDWLTKIVENFDEKIDFVLGYGGYFSQKGFLNRFIRYDTLFIAIQYFSFALAGFPYMGVGRNLAYRKSVFFDNKGFSKHLHLVSGDDDLFVNENANRKNTEIVIHQDSFTRSTPNKTFKTWFYQKKRHLTTAPYYRFKHKFLLGLELLSRMIFYIAFITGIVYPNLIYLFLIGFFVRFFVQITIIKKAAVKFNETGIFYLGIIFDFIIPIINFIVHLSNLKFRKRK